MAQRTAHRATGKQRAFIWRLRRELRLPEGPIPTTRPAASREIDRLLARKGRRPRREGGGPLRPKPGTKGQGRDTRNWRTGRRGKAAVSVRRATPEEIAELLGESPLA